MENQNQQTTQPQYQQTVVIVGKQKSVGVAFLLAFLFGPLGLLYASVVGGIVMIIVSVLVAIVTLGFGLLITWPVCIIWAIIAANNANKKMASGAGINISTNFGNPPIQQPPTTETINPQPQVQQQYTPPIQQPLTSRQPSPSFSEQIAPVVSSIGDFISKNKILLISAIAVVAIGFAVYTFLKTDPIADGKKAASAICDCYKKQNEQMIDIYNKYISDFDSYKFSGRPAAWEKLNALQQSVNNVTQHCLDINKEKYSMLKAQYITDKEQVEKFDYAFNAQQAICNSSSNEVNSLYNTISTKINNYIGPVEKEQARENSIAEAQIDVAFRNAMKNIPSIDRMKQDLLGKKLSNANGGNLSNESASWIFEQGEIRKFNITGNTFDKSTRAYKGNIEMELLGSHGGRCHSTAIIEYTWDIGTNTWNFKNIVSIEFHRI